MNQFARNKFHWLRGLLTFFISLTGAQFAATDQGAPGLIGVPQTLYVQAQMLLLRDYSIVVLGQFEFNPEDVSDEDIFTLRNVATTFRINEVFRGPDSSVVTIEVRSDMLSYPGDVMTRYEKRWLLANEFSAKVKVARGKLDALEAALKEKKIDREEYERSKVTLDTRLHQIALEYTSIPGLRRVAVLHGSSFYDEGGVIRSNQQFLLAIKATESGDYIIGEVMEGNIFWGDKALEIAKLLRAM